MKLLIVDDQRVVLERLREIISWERLGIDHLYLAESAAEAKRTAKKHGIDILMTDIEMPVENGLELAEWFREYDPQIPCIFLTAYADFSYAKEAIANGGFDYILQPARAEEIEQVILRCIEYLKKSRKMHELAQKGLHYDEVHKRVIMNLVKKLFETEDGDGSVSDEWEHEVNQDHLYEWYLPVILMTGQQEHLQIRQLLTELPEGSVPFFCAEGERLGDYRQLYVMICGAGERWGRRETERFCGSVYEELSSRHGVKIMMYAGETDERALSERIIRLKRMRDDNVLLTPGVFMVKERRGQRTLREPDREEWKRWMLSGDGQLIQNQIRNLLSFSENEHQLTLGYMKNLWQLFLDVYNICCYLKHIDGRKWFDESYSYEVFLQAFRNVDEFNRAIEFVIDHFQEVLKQEKEEAQEENIAERITDVCTYINENLEKNISRAEVAAMTYLSEDYFTKVFRSVTGYGFKEYVMTQKMDYCKRLLKETGYPVGVIAGKAGYDNFSNFSKIFKKYTGMTPQEYRNAEKE